MVAPDLTAPRFRYKTHSNLNTDLITRFKAKYPQYSHYDTSLLIKALKMHNGLIWQQVLDSRDGVELPELGNLFIGSWKGSKKGATAWKQSVELGIRVSHRNWDTDNRLCKIVYSNYHTRLKNRAIWYFTGVRQFKRAVKTVASKNWTKYIRMDDFRNLQLLFDKCQFRDRARARQKEDLVRYNEFDI